MISRRAFFLGALAAPALVRASSLDFVPRPWVEAALPPVMMPPDRSLRADMAMLQFARPRLVLQQFGKPPFMPNKAHRVEFRRSAT